MVSLTSQKVRLFEARAGRNESTQGFHSLRHGFVAAFADLCALSCLSHTSKRNICPIRKARMEPSGPDVLALGQ